MRALIRRSSETGAWAALERGELTHGRVRRSRSKPKPTRAGFRLDARKLMALIGSALGPRPEMVRADRAHPRARAAHRRAHEQLGRRAATARRRTRLHDTLAFDVVVESAVEGLRKPDPRIYALALARLDVLASEAVFLDDLGINLKPARAMGMTTIKVVDPADALAELEARPRTSTVR